MTRKTKINKKELAAILRESIFAPSKSGPLKVIIDVGDARYYTQRALELATLSLQSPIVDQCEYYLEQAIALLAVAKHCIRINSQPDMKTVEKSMKAIKRNQTKPIQQVVGETVKKEIIDCDRKKEKLRKLVGDPY